MESLKVNSTLIRLAINDSPNKIIQFDPGDVRFRKKFYNLRNVIFEKEREFDIKAKQLENIESEENIKRCMQMEEELFDFLSNLINDLFGEKTTEYICEDRKNVDTICNFVIAVAPYFQKYNENARNKYVNNLKQSGVI